jgi:hypothetical protein
VDWQLAIVVMCVLAAAAYVARAAWRTWHPKPGSCGGGCGCAKPAPPAETDVRLIPVEEVTLRRG